MLFLVPYLPLLGLAFFLLWSAARESGQPANRMIKLGLVLLAVALALRAIAAVVSVSALTVAGWQRTLGIATLHDTELLAWIAVAVGLGLASGLGGGRGSRRPEPR